MLKQSKVMKNLIIIALAITLTGCVTEKKCQKKYPPRVDSTVIYKDVIKWRDTVIYKELPPLVIERYIDVNDTLRLAGNYSKATSWVVGDKLHGWLKEGENPVKIEYKIKEVEVIKTKVVREVERVKFVPKFTQWLAWVGVIAFALIIIRIVLRFIK